MRSVRKNSRRFYQSNVKMSIRLMLKCNVCLNSHLWLLNDLERRLLDISPFLTHTPGTAASLEYV